MMHKKTLMRLVVGVAVLAVGLAMGDNVCAKERAEIVIGTPLPVTGILAMAALEQKWAYEQAVADINAIDTRKPSSRQHLQQRSSGTSNFHDGDLTLRRTQIIQESDDEVPAGHEPPMGVFQLMVDFLKVSSHHVPPGCRLDFNRSDNQPPGPVHTTDRMAIEGLCRTTPRGLFP